MYKIEKIGPYPITGFIVRGGTSVVYESFHNTLCRKIAIKLVKRNRVTQQQIKSEIEINKEIDCDYIMPIIDIVEKVPSKYYCAIIMNKAVGTDLLGLILSQGQLTEHVAVQVANAGLKALEYLHSNGICHRDIKPDNFFLMDDDINKLDIVLADFGHATHFSEKEKMKDYTIGTTLYAAPEILNGIPCLF